MCVSNTHCSMERKFLKAASSNFYYLRNNAAKFGLESLKISTLSLDFSAPKASTTQETIAHENVLNHLCII